MKVEVVCSTMFQKDLSIYDKMNIQSNVVFSNQDDRHEYCEKFIQGNRVKMITTPFRGVGKNRNQALLNSNEDILIFSDDDMVYVDGYVDIVKKAYREIPDADIIIFNLGSIGDKTTRRVNQKVKRARIYNVLNYGFPRVTVKRTSIEKSNLWVSTLFGGGSRYSSGEDNLFIIKALKLGLKVYVSPVYIGSVKTGDSTWFNGLNAKYFFDKGAWLENAFPILKHFLVWYFIYKYVNKTTLTTNQILKLQYKGMNAFRNGLDFNDWFTNQETVRFLK